MINKNSLGTLRQIIFVIEYIGFVEINYILIKLHLFGLKEILSDEIYNNKKVKTLYYLFRKILTKIDIFATKN